MEATQNRIFLTVKETALDKIVTVPLNMSKPNKTRVDNISPPTPPSDEEKRSVSFDPSVKTLSIPKDFSYSNGFINSPSESIDISVRDCSEEMLVSLKERDTEIKDLVVHNQEFFDTVKQSIFEDDETWEKFEKVLYSKREEIPDYITPIRYYPHALENFEKSYPQFFINAKQELGKLGKERSRRGSTLGRNHLSNDNPLLHPNIEDHQPLNDSSVTLYDELKRVLVIPRDEMDDFEWETAINEILDVSPPLLEHFYEIVIEEINQNIGL
ncbi:18718_t:CDS:2 [Rhizophagus irregularis]|nr:18718_t:CDS:2 [Rhizophagus irregularis]